MLDKILLIKEILELVHHFRKLILVIILLGIALVILFTSWVSKINLENEQKTDKIWTSINIGDSIFVKENIYYLDFYKKGREELADYEQKEINYRREDTLNFIKQNSVHEKYFYQNKTSFVGICLGRDSTITKQGTYNKHRWIKIKPAYKISHPPKSDEYDYTSRKWEDKREDYFVTGKLSKNFYVNFEDVTNINNDKIFNK